MKETSVKKKPLLRDWFDYLNKTLRLGTNIRESFFKHMQERIGQYREWSKIRRKRVCHGLEKIVKGKSSLD